MKLFGGLDHDLIRLLKIQSEHFKPVRDMLAEQFRRDIRFFDDLAKVRRQVPMFEETEHPFGNRGEF